ncbi:acyl carrier protein [Paenibacillus hemerocallicola]|uniref:Acyl carrier protein n=1 Tax=Paenibacillus hemerocallicola TaxID=1172614 RepID=A0A5C4T5M2_9BACL|nr:acyl carrier protein [Paenibacillus hemerocallicola]TNJ64371.1 acyl carrier protein [Paenibacillus hemerocallicola]
MQTTSTVTMVSDITAKVNEILETDHNIAWEEELTSLGLDSIKSVNLIVDLEEMYHIVFDEDELLTENFSTISKIVARVQGKLG